MQFSTYTLMYGLAFILGGLLVLHRFNGKTRTDGLIRNGLVLIVFFIFIGLFLPSTLESYLKSWLTGTAREPAHMRVYYGLGLGLLAGFIYIRRQKLSFLGIADHAIPVFGLAFAIARLGCLAAGCCGGAMTTSFLGMSAADTNGVWAMRYPTQLMSAGFELILFFGLTTLEKNRPGWLKTDGAIFYLYIFLFCLERFSLEWMRADYRPLFGAFSLPHVYMLAGMAAVAFSWILAARRSALQPA
jgi:phosphatidylglycerol---prolipoprotein diacylglyceryl transferase